MSSRSSTKESSLIGDRRRYGHLIRLKPEYRGRYVALHAHPFPGLIDRMHDAGLRNYSIFLKDDRLFSYYEYVGDNFESDMDAMADDDTVQDWWTLTDPMQEPLPEREEGAWWLRMEEFYHGGPKIVPTEQAQRMAFVSTFRDGTTPQIQAAYGELGEAFVKALAETNFQNYTVYGRDTRRYTYLEYAGDDFQADRARLRSTAPMEQLRQTLKPRLVSHAAGHNGSASGRMDSIFFAE